MDAMMQIVHSDLDFSVIFFKKSISFVHTHTHVSLLEFFLFNFCSNCYYITLSWYHSAYIITLKKSVHPDGQLLHGTGH